METAPQQDDPSEPDAGARLASLEGRLDLLLAHLAGRAVRARVELEDLRQEVWLRALTAPGGLPPTEPGEAALWRFLVRLAKHAVIDCARALRAAKRDGDEVRLARSDWTRVGHGPREDELLARTAGPATRLVAHETSERLRERFEALSPEHRRVLGLRQFEGLSAREAGRRMGRTESAVHSLYRRALMSWEEGLEPENRAARGESAPRRRPDAP